MTMKSRYQENINEAVSKGLLVINGNRLLIELLEEQEKVTHSGIVVSTGAKTRMNLEAADAARAAVVLAVGPGYTAEDTNEHIDVPYKAGDYILVNQFAVKTFGEFFELRDYKANTVGLITDDLIQGRMGDPEELNIVLKRR